MAREFIIDSDNKTATIATGIEDNDTVSTASVIELTFLEIQIIKIEDNGIAVRISSGADIAAITKENNDLILVKGKFDPMAITDKMILCWSQIKIYLE